MTAPDWLTGLIQTEINDAISNDNRTTSTTFLGYPRDRVFTDIIMGGQADFDHPLPQWKLKAADVVLLYAKYNQGRHLDELIHAFSSLLGPNQKITKPTILDIGCGPFTGGLAFAAIQNSDEPFRYFGVDRSKAMIQLGESLAEAAKARGAFHPKTTFKFDTDLANFDFGPIRGEMTIVIASYLLASPSLDVKSLVTSVSDALARIGPGPCAILYTNSSRPEAREKFPSFKEALLRLGFKLVTEDIAPFHHTSKKVLDLHYALLLRTEASIFL
ncbi:class I SAM-dependent methyltransferase [Janthinobacterium agaricidamnosum]|uniref:class I SAM-dependent methyltransferase n=1 Tax=Janthinobacterium agaricidamnosum TaxID=55508 RepID=UPI000B0D6924|nr:class I SAM-dependent methyltransferase [Janthinobacterium agaricidamnosum]